MSEEKLSALRDLVATPKELHKLVQYERKLKEANTFLFIDCRKIIINSQKSSQFLDEAKRFLPQVKSRIDSLIDRSRYDDLRFRPGMSDKARKIITNNCILFDLIIFSRSWDLKTEIKELDELIIFGEADKIKTSVKSILEHIQIIDELISSKDNVKTTVQKSEEVAENLFIKFNQELDFAENAGALKGILKLEKPKVIGKGRYYEQLSNIILKVAFSFGIEHSDEPISIGDISQRLNRQFPHIQADLKDVLKSTQMLSDNGFLVLKEDRQGVYWVQLKPDESEANIILALAEEKGFLTIEELVRKTDWTLEKAQEEMEKFVAAGYAIKDAEYATGVKYYFPGLTKD
ncbi:MAG: hypothetical protein FK730_06685 [Asgard group archaeon]|nr:hypothetical protein [Asgard group archaeon]